MENEIEIKDKRTTKIIVAGAAVLALVIAVLLGAAINNSKNEATTSSSDYTVVEPAPVDTLSTDDKYLAVLHSFGNYVIENNTDADLIAVGKQVCTALDAGNTVTDLQWALIGDSDGTESDAYWEFAGAVIGAGVAAYCPEYEYQIG